MLSGSLPIAKSEQVYIALHLTSSSLSRHFAENVGLSHIGISDMLLPIPSCMTNPRKPRLPLNSP